MEEKFCPLKQIVDKDNPSYYRQCDHEKCAWWEADYGGCPVKALPYMLDQVAVGTNSGGGCR